MIYQDLLFSSCKAASALSGHSGERHSTTSPRKAMLALIAPAHNCLINILLITLLCGCTLCIKCTREGTDDGVERFSPVRYSRYLHPPAILRKGNWSCVNASQVQTGKNYIIKSVHFNVILFIVGITVRSLFPLFPLFSVEQIKTKFKFTHQNQILSIVIKEDHIVGSICNTSMFSTSSIKSIKT